MSNLPIVEKEHLNEHEIVPLTEVSGHILAGPYFQDALSEYLAKHKGPLDLKIIPIETGLWIDLNLDGIPNEIAKDLGIDLRRLATWTQLANLVGLHIHDQAKTTDDNALSILGITMEGEGIAGFIKTKTKRSESWLASLGSK